MACLTLASGMGTFLKFQDSMHIVLRVKCDAGKLSL